MDKYQNEEFFTIVRPILENKEFQKMKEVEHHGITRYDHSLRVAYFAYKVLKILRLDYIEATEAAMLHDFFIDEVDDDNEVARLRNHPSYAVKNAKKYFQLSEKQEDIIKTHMFPITFTPPRYLESWIVDIVDDVAAVYEKGYTLKTEMQAATTFMFILLINVIKFR